MLENIPIIKNIKYKMNDAKKVKRHVFFIILRTCNLLLFLDLTTPKINNTKKSMATLKKNHFPPQIVSIKKCIATRNIIVDTSAAN